MQDKKVNEVNGTYGSKTNVISNFYSYNKTYIITFKKVFQNNTTVPNICYIMTLKNIKRIHLIKPNYGLPIFLTHNVAM